MCHGLPLLFRRHAVPLPLLVGHDLQLVGNGLLLLFRRHLGPETIWRCQLRLCLLLWLYLLLLRWRWRLPGL